MKKVLLALFACLTFNAFAQVHGRIITDHVAVQDMVWSESDQKLMFFDKVERHTEFTLIETDLNSELAGKLKITAVSDRATYDFMVYAASFPETDMGSMMRLECMEVSSGNKCTILIHKFEDRHMVSVMLPSSRIAIFFDNLDEQ
jgi:hypothetical protein